MTNMGAFQQFNPFTVWPKDSLGVPGTSLRASSIEGIWQGLKLVDGSADHDMLASTPFKRPTDAQRRTQSGYLYSDSMFDYGGKSIPLLTARFLIYAIAYLELIDSIIDEALIDRIFEHADKGGEVIFCDWDASPLIADCSVSFSHSALITSWFSGNLERDLFRPANDALPRLQFTRFMLHANLRLNRYRKVLAKQASSAHLL